MRLPLPETLFGRLFAATVAVVATALLVLLSIVLRERRELVFSESGSGAAAASIVEVSQQLARLPPDQRDSMLAQLRAEHQPRHPHEHMRGDVAVAQRTFAGEVQRELGDQFAVSARPPRGGHHRVVPIAGAPPPPPPGRMFDLVVTLPDGDRVAQAEAVRAAYSRR